MKKIAFWFYRIFNPKRCFVGTDTSENDYSCLIYGYIDNKKRHVLVGEKFWVE